MHRKRRLQDIILVAVALTSAGCLGQQVQEAIRSSAPIPPLAVATFTSQLASESGRSATISMEPALHGVLAPNRQPTRGRLPQSFIGPRNEVGIFTNGNLNPVSFISVQNTPHVAVSSNKSSLGGSAEYRRWFSDHHALGLLYAQNPSDGKLLWQGQNYIWPQMRWDLSVLATESFSVRNMAPFVCGGPGIVLTNGYGISGWSAGFAFVAGLGTDYQLSRRFSARTGITFLDTRSGCYDDPTCRDTWGVVEDLRVGLVYKWGEGKSSYFVR
jgi:hypothetical protein